MSTPGSESDHSCCPQLIFSSNSWESWGNRLLEITCYESELCQILNCSIHAKHGRVWSIFQKHIFRAIEKTHALTLHRAQTTIPTQSDTFKQLPRTNISLMYINNDVNAAVDLCRAHHHQNQEIQNLHFSHNISRFLYSCESYLNSMSNISIEASANSKYYLWYSEYPLRTHIIRYIKKTKSVKSWFLKIIWIKFWRRLYPWKLTLNTMKLLLWCHSIDFMSFYICLKNDTNIWPKCFWTNTNRRVIKETKTDMESATFN